jgi:lipoprotein-anchoring transpeptidase ErfK/SrfK
MLTRRSLVGLALASGLSACMRPQDDPVTRAETAPAVPAPPPMPDLYGAITDEPYPIPAIPPGSIRPELWRQEVANPWPDRARGTIIVDPDAALLFFVQSPARALRYGVSVGAQGFSWSGTARLQFRREWPRWKVPQSMIDRQPELAPYSVANGGMDPGPGNPMGARALYLFQNGVDTLYRIHGGATPEGLGRAVSSGCIRLLDQDAIDLYDRAIHGADVVVLSSIRGGDAPPLY